MPFGHFEAAVVTSAKVDKQLKPAEKFAVFVHNSRGEHLGDRPSVGLKRHPRREEENRGQERDGGNADRRLSDSPAVKEQFDK